MQPGANYYEAITIYSSGEGVINLGEALKGLGKKRAIENESENENENANLPSALRDLVEKGAAFVKPNFANRYKNFWQSVLNHPDFIALFQKPVPNGFRGGYNKKLFCNILGFLQEKGFFTIPNKQLDGTFIKTIDGKTGAKYLNNFLPEKDGRPSSDTELTPILIPILTSYAE